jgi:hypothetical protein
VPRDAIRLVVLLNVLWAVDAVLLLAVGPVAPSAGGSVLLVVQAAAASGFALAHRAGLRNATDTGARRADRADAR